MVDFEIKEIQISTNLYDIVKVIADAEMEKYGKVSIRHNKAMQKIKKLSETTSFGAVPILGIAYNDAGQTIDTYSLTPKQAIAAGAKLNNDMLMSVIDYVDSLGSKKENINITDSATDEEILSRAIMIAQKTISELEDKVKRDKPYIDYAKTISMSDGDMSIRDWVKLMHGDLGLNKDIGERKVIALLIEKNILYRTGRRSSLRAYAKWIKNGSFNMGVGVSDLNGRKIEYSTLRLTSKGRDVFSPMIIKYFKEKNE